MTLHENFKPVLHSFNGPVTALAFWCQKAIIGCGNEVSIYCPASLCLETRKQVLHGASIHGFSQGGLSDNGSQLICVFGAKQACIIALKVNGDNTTNMTVVSDIAHFPDWMWEARWVNYMKSTNAIAVALAHNTVALWDWKTKQIIRHQDCVEKCILYCAHFIGDTWTDLVLAAGTVFNQVVLWLVCHDTHTEDVQESARSPAPVMHTLSGHKGVIFSIQYHAQHQRLCSVSDDRSIRMWQVDFPNGRTSTPKADDWKGMKSSLLLSVFGHSARVFDAVLMTDCFASVGEDATCCIWDYAGQVLLKFKGHKGKCIWSVAATQDEQNILTGGGDGSVRMWKINKGQDNSPAQHILDVSKTFLMEKDDFPRTVTLLDFDRVLIMMNSGSLYCYSMSRRQYNCVFKDIRFTSYSVVSVCPDKMKVAVASIGGIVKVLKLVPGQLLGAPSFEKSLFDNKILGLVWLSQDIFIVSGQNGVCHILQTKEEIDASDSPGLIIEVKSSLFLPLAKHRWVSAACFVESRSDSAIMLAMKLLACGDKDGTIYLYHLYEDLGTTSDFIQPIQTFHRIHGKNGVTHVSFHDGVLYSVGRDGCCRHWGVEEKQLILRHGSKVVKGFEWIDRLDVSNGDLMFYGFFSTQFVIWSQRYNQKMFYVECGGGHRSWGCCHDNGVFRFAYLKGGLLSVVDSAQCSKHEILKPPLHGRELHDVKLLEIASTQNYKPCFLTFTASEDTTVNVGSFHYINGFTQWKPLATLKGHLSSVRCLVLCKSGKYRSVQGSDNVFNDVPNSQSDLILFTGGGRAEIRVWKVQVKDSSVNDVMCSKTEENKRTNIACEEERDFKMRKECFETGESGNDGKKGIDSVATTHQEWSTHYLGESRHKRPFSKWKTRKLHLDPETRVMSLDATSLCDIGVVADFCDAMQDKNSFDIEHLHIVSAAGSDGLLRIFFYNDHTRKLTPIAQSTFHQGCVLKVLHFHFKSKDNNLFFALSTSTNGKIAIWLLDRVLRQSVAVKGEIRISQKCNTDEQYTETKMPPEQEVSLPVSHSKVAEGCESHGAFSMDRDTADKEDDADETDDFHPVCSLPAHQSGINGLHAFQVDDSTFLLASGGDDNALTVQVIKVKGQEVKVKCHNTNEYAHSAQITGLRVVSEKLLVSVSIDQRICVWGLDISDDKIQMELLSCSYIYLADVSCMDVYVHRNAVYLCLGGEGLCLYSWKMDQSSEKAISLEST